MNGRGSTVITHATDEMNNRSDKGKVNEFTMLFRGDKCYFTTNENCMVSVFPARFTLIMMVHLPAMDKSICAR